MLAWAAGVLAAGVEAGSEAVEAAVVGAAGVLPLVVDVYFLQT